MEDVPKLKIQPLTGQPRISALVVVKKSSATQNPADAVTSHHMELWSILLPAALPDIK